MTNDKGIRQMIETAAAALDAAPKVSYSSTFQAQESGDHTASVLVTTHCHIDRTARRAHMVVHESHSHVNHVAEYYLDGDTQYVRTAAGWRRSKTTAAAAERFFARGGAFQLLHLQAQRAPEVMAKSNGAVTTLRFGLGAEDIRAAMPNAANQVLVGNALLEVDVGTESKTIEGLRVESSAARGESNSQGRQLIDVRVRVLSPTFRVSIPAQATAGATAAGGEELTLSPDAANACWCPGCAACTACLACLACISCVACLFPPLLAPVTAAAAGTAVAAAISAATGISTATATAIQAGG